MVFYKEKFVYKLNYIILKICQFVVTPNQLKIWSRNIVYVCLLFRLNWKSEKGHVSVEKQELYLLNSYHGPN